MKLRKNILICAFLLSAMILQIALSTGPTNYDPLVDINDDGRIDILDITSLAVRFNTEGTPINKTLLTEIEQKYAKYVYDYSLLMKEVNSRNCMSTTFFSVIFVMPEDPSVREAVYNITGILPGDEPGSRDDIMDIYEWVRDNIEYREDPLYPILPSEPSGTIKYLPDMWQFPNETLRLKRGDCEDQAVLLCSMIRCCTQMRSWVDCIWITDNLSSHLAVQMPVLGWDPGQNGLMIFDPLLSPPYYTSDYAGNLVYKDVTVEINNYLSRWQPKFKGELYPWRIFSDWGMMEFASTGEYTEWMYNR
jgi:hypothetical protein